MPMDNFSALLGRRRNPESISPLDPEGPASRVSIKVAEVMLSLGGCLAKNAARKASYYEETADSAAIPPPLTLFELKERIAGATSIAELRVLRRRFASTGHPDRHQPSEGAAATLEMAAANQMIDEAIGAMRRPR